MDTVLYLIEKSVLNPTTSTGQTFLVVLFAMWIGSCINVNKRQTARRKSQSNNTNK